MSASSNHPASTSRVRVRAWRRFARAVRDGGERYERWRCLPRLIGVEFCEIEDTSREVALSILSRLDGAIARERRRLRTGHWSYDVNRHIALLQARRGEKRLLTARNAPVGEVTALTGDLPRGDQARAPAISSIGSSASSDMRSALLTGTNAS